MSESLLDTPEGFVWLFDRLTLGCMTPTEQAQWRAFHEEVWEQMLQDPEVHDGCVPADDLRQAEFDLRRTIEEHAHELDDARDEGYRQACADITARIEAMTPRRADASGPVYVGGFDEARKRIVTGIAKTRDRGPARDPEPSPLVAA